MQVRNNYEIVWHRDGGEQGVGAYNGDIGIVESINTRTGRWWCGWTTGS